VGHLCIQIKHILDLIQILPIITYPHDSMAILPTNLPLPEAFDDQRYFSGEVSLHFLSH